MKKQIKDFLQIKKSEHGGKLSKKAGYILVVGLVGLLLIIIGNIFSTSATDDNQSLNNVTSEAEKPAEETFSDKSKNTSNADEIEKSYEDNLKEMLDKIQGVSNVEVMVNLESTNVKVYEKNLIAGQQSTTESDKNGGTREIEDNTKETQVVLVRQGDKEVPLLIQIKKPEVRGVFVVAKGVDHATVKKWVIDSVSRVLDVPTHRVSVMPKN
ncbi:stage III sporulation protein AG [Virgibacillus litoralis]|uniref:Stage III sporulation protein AG n=1 Tax=Virgibacillus litoralis TaxID=578221 RepID=A0ABS4HHJ7_9BACI|nr:stage III sporulation protein AG [Virgibacillus litoralis]MBP1950386.1 stage III sporulation protein AG [Virgibacillus litoralis]